MQLKIFTLILLSIFTLFISKATSASHKIKSEKTFSQISFGPGFIWTINHRTSSRKVALTGATKESSKLWHYVGPSQELTISRAHRWENGFFLGGHINAGHAKFLVGQFSEYDSDIAPHDNIFLGYLLAGPMLGFYPSAKNNIFIEFFPQAGISLNTAKLPTFGLGINAGAEKMMGRLAAIGCSIGLHGLIVVSKSYKEFQYTYSDIHIPIIMTVNLHLKFFKR